MAFGKKKKKEKTDEKQKQKIENMMLARSMHSKYLCEWQGFLTFSVWIFKVKIKRKLNKDIASANFCQGQFVSLFRVTI